MSLKKQNIVHRVVPTVWVIRDLSLHSYKLGLSVYQQIIVNPETQTFSHTEVHVPDSREETAFIPHHRDDNFRG